MENLSNKTVREIALANPVSTRVFEELKIDFCCGGKKNFAQACLESGVDADAVAARIDAESRKSESSEDFDFRTATELIAHIESTHHVFTRTEINALPQLMDKVAGKHSQSHPNLVQLKQAVFELLADLEPHLLKEERILFPYISNLERYESIGETPPPPPFGTVRNPVAMMSKEHDNAGDLLRRIRRLADEFEPPENACLSFRALYARLADLEADLHMHIHKENNILFPMALRLEERFG
ncbi:MAG: iron-sulfur cluster repair di-iron protein [Pyrinomonadaceae bacterium]